MEFDEIYRSYFHIVYRYTVSLTNDPDLAQEVTQETFVRAMQALKRFDGQKDIRAWLFTIAKNAWISMCRRQKRSCAEPVSVRCEDTIAEHMMDTEAAERIHSYLHQMQEPYKEVFTLRVLGELPYEKIGALFGKSDGWARVTYYRAKKMLMEKMEEWEHGKA